MTEETSHLIMAIELKKFDIALCMLKHVDAKYITLKKYSRLTFRKPETIFDVIDKLKNDTHDEKLRMIIDIINEKMVDYNESESEHDEIEEYNESENYNEV
jgi:hypothetical protein